MRRARYGHGLEQLAGIGPAMLRDFDVLGVHSLEELAGREPEDMFAELEYVTGRRQDPCVLDTFRCAVAQARDPELPEYQKMWWYWSRQRKAGRC